MDGSQAPASPSVIHWPGAPGGGRLRLRVERVTEADVDAAFDVLADATHWLAQRGRRQRISRLTREVYGRWQREQGNFAVWAGTRIVGVFTLVREPLAEWPRVSIRGPVLWLRALATHPDHRGREIGRRAVRVAQALAAREAYLYLDCVSAFLPAYYAALGFEPIARQVIETPDLGPLEVTLMRSATGRRSPSEGHCQVDENSVESPRRHLDLV